MLSCSDAIARIKWTKDEERILAKLEAVIDSVLRDKFDGVPVQLPFVDQIAPKIASALQRKYEEGGWKVSITAGARLTVQITPQVPSAARIVSMIEGQTLGHVVEGQKLPQLPLPMPQHVLPAGLRILVHMPTRGRPAQAIRVLEKYRNMAGFPIQIEVAIDVDDEAMLACEVQQRLVALGCRIVVSDNMNKVEACNSGGEGEWDIVLLASDDMVPVQDGWAVNVLNAMEQHFPHLDGAIFFDDSMQGPNLCTLPIVGRRWWKQNSYCIYSPEYMSLYCDTEQTELWREMGRLVYVDEKIIEHRHPAWGKADLDDLYTRNNSLSNRDEAVYLQRKSVTRQYGQWAFDAPPLWLTISILTIPARRRQLNQLLDHLWSQIFELPEPLNVEILIDDGEGTTGAKRQRLLDKAKGHFFVAIDDDDWVSYDYMKRVVGTIVANPDVDCLSLRGTMTTAGEVPESFFHSITDKTEEAKKGVYVREPNHISPVRTEHARKTGFSDIHYVEDADYSARLRPLLHREASTGDKPLYFYFYSPRKE